MEVDFAGKTFFMSDMFTGETVEKVVFAAILPYSQYIYAEGMFTTKELQWIEVNKTSNCYSCKISTDFTICANPSALNFLSLESFEYLEDPMSFLM